MTRKIIEYFGGRIWLDAAFAGGARFLFTLPVPEEAQPSRNLALDTSEQPEDEENDARVREL
jgi:hypothetical protein